MKSEYVEMWKGSGLNYSERIVPEHEVRALIRAGWSISRLTKLSPEKLLVKWKNAIDAMENMED